MLVDHKVHQVLVLIHHSGEALVVELNLAEYFKQKSPQWRLKATRLLLQVLALEFENVLEPHHRPFYVRTLLHFSSDERKQSGEVVVGETRAHEWHRLQRNALVDNVDHLRFVKSQR